MTDIAHERYYDLRRRANNEGIRPDAMFVLYALKGFLARLSASGRRNDFV